jgi:hypothetical protein
VSANVSDLNFDMCQLTFQISFQTKQKTIFFALINCTSIQIVSHYYLYSDQIQKYAQQLFHQPSTPRTQQFLSHFQSRILNFPNFANIAAIVAISSALAVFGIVGAGFCYHRVRRNSKASEDVEYPAYGVTGPKGAGGKDISPTSGTDRKLAQNAQMYHYQHQKQQMIAFDR